MKIRIYEFPLNPVKPGFRLDTPVERGYIEIADEDRNKCNEDWCWDVCNWEHHADKKKPECLHSDMSHCDHGIVFVYPSDLEADGLHFLALTNGWLRGPKDLIQKYATAHKDKIMWVNSEQEQLLEDKKNTFAPMKVSVAVPTANGDVALVKVNDFADLDDIKKNGMTKEMIANAEKLKHNDDVETVDNILQQIEVGRVYRHFKGKLYLVLDLATHSETGEQYVVYKALYGDCKTYIRPYLMFASEVDREKYPDVKQEFRFQLVED